ncbi:DUF6292 family protein [Amycolatopsis sp. NPDC058340]|uniref:DUF6292 family protein n=1 Tax=Amycolatopsis sp. NPDC058340 TaxID=3346453 RepID=UPI003669E2BC
MVSLLTGIELDHDLRCGLAGYLVAVTAAVGVAKESWAMDLDHPASAYIALDQRLPRQPERDTALQWDERHGWAFAMETQSGEDLLVLAYFEGELVPSPDTVGRSVTAIQTTGGASATPVPPEPRADRDHVRARLPRYRRDIWAATAPRSHLVISPGCS